MSCLLIKAWMLFPLLAVVASGVLAEQPFSTRRYGRVEADIRSDYSSIRIRKNDSTRTLLFIRDSGEEVVESMVDLDRPNELLIEYTRFMFLSYAHRPVQKKVLIVGLGGGSMVHFLRKHDPQVEVHVVEIDPAIIEAAEKYFKVSSEGRVKIIQVDAFKYLAETQERYDVVYMDAFLKPSRDTDPNGVPLALKTAKFYAQIQEKLTPNGLVLFNLNPHAGTRNDITDISAAFRNTYVYRVPTGGFVVAAATVADRDSFAVVLRQAKAADKRLVTTFSLERLAHQLQR